MMPSSTRNGGRLPAGFTLVEILVVGVMVALLLTLTLGVAGAVRTKAKATQCASNLRQLALATTIYQQENGGLFPKAA